MSDESPRLQEFQTQVDELKLTGGRANPERLGVRIAIGLFVIAMVLEVVAYVGSTNTSNDLEQRDFMILALLGVVVALGAVALYIRMSMTRYLRYWLIRLVFEDRANTDRLIEALGDDD